MRPVTATAVRVDWSLIGPGWEVTFILREQSYSVARERVIYQNERVCRGNTSVTVEVNDVHPGYQHMFSVRHSVQLVERGECEGEAAATTFEFGECWIQSVLASLIKILSMWLIGSAGTCHCVLLNQGN